MLEKIGSSLGIYSFYDISLRKGSDKTSIIKFIILNKP